MPKFSFLVPVYNKIDFLPRSLYSMLFQTYGDFEVVCVDDCSSDGSYEFLREISKEFPKLFVYKNQRNMGLGENRNILLSKAKGEYVIFADPDDYVELDLLENIYDELRLNDLDVVRFQNVVEAITPRRQDYESRKSPYRFCCEPTDVLSGTEAFCEWMFGVNKINTMPWTYCVKRDLYDGVKYPKFSVLEDFAVTPYLVAQAKNVKATNFLGYHYIQYDSSLTGKGDSVQEEIDIRTKKLGILEQVTKIARKYIEKSKLPEYVKNRYYDELNLKLEDKKLKLQNLLSKNEFSVGPKKDS